MERRRLMCKAWEDMKRAAAGKAAEKATEEAEERTLLQAFSNIMEALHLSAEQAMTILKVPEAKRSKLSARL